MHKLIYLPALCFAMPALAQAPEASPAEKPAQEKTIIVTANPLSETERALRDCIARKCPPDEDAKATLAHAENQFVSGDYKSARGTLQKSIGRNSGAAKQHPLPVSNLYRANARIAANLGEGDDYRLSTLRTRDALKEGLGNDDWRVLAATIEVADMRAKTGYLDEARDLYYQVSAKAKAKGWAGLSDLANLRGALLMIESEYPDEQAAARKRLKEFAERPGDGARNLRIASKIMLAREAKKRNRSDADAATKSLMEEYRTEGGISKRPQLLFAEPIRRDEPRSAREGRTAVSQMATSTVEDNWVDIGFWVTADGKASEIEIIRQSQKDVVWTKPVLKSISSRIYAPLALEPGDPGFFMVERYTLTALWENQLGTRIRQRSGLTKIERVDLTDLPPATPANTAG
jgi:hypothetical protein